MLKRGVFGFVGLLRVCVSDMREAITPGDPLKSNDAFQINRAAWDSSGFDATGKGKRVAGRFPHTEK